MSYPKTGEEVYVSLNLSNTMLTGLGKGTITREDVSVDYLKKLFMQHGVIVSAKPEYRNIMERVNSTYDLGLEIPAKLQLFQLSEQHRRLVVVNISGLQRKNGSLLPSYTEEELDEATFTFVKYYVQGDHDELMRTRNNRRSSADSERAEFGTKGRGDGNLAVEKAASPLFEKDSFSAPELSAESGQGKTLVAQCFLPRTCRGRKDQTSSRLRARNSARLF